MLGTTLFTSYRVLFLQKIGNTASLNFFLHAFLYRHSRSAIPAPRAEDWAISLVREFLITTLSSTNLTIVPLNFGFVAWNLPSACKTFVFKGTKCIYFSCYFLSKGASPQAMAGKAIAATYSIITTTIYSQDQLYSELSNSVNTGTFTSVLNNYATSLGAPNLSGTSWMACFFVLCFHFSLIVSLFTIIIKCHEWNNMIVFVCALLRLRLHLEQSQLLRRRWRQRW